MNQMNVGAEETISFVPSSINLPQMGHARFRQVMYRLFAALFLYPDETRLSTLGTTAKELLDQIDFRESFPFSSSLELLLEALSILKMSDERAIRDEYNSLFSIKPQAPPYESYYMDPEGQFRGWIAAKLEGEYNEAGLALSPTLNELPDHIAVELEYMSYLCDLEARARELGKEADGEYHIRQRAFMHRHLAQWFPKFMERVKDSNPEHLYHLVIDAISVFLRHEIELLRLPGAPQI